MTAAAVRLLREFSAWLTLRRITAHGAIAASIIWLMFAFNETTHGLLDRVGNLKGTDFLQFYLAGTFARTYRIAKMYGVSQFAAETARAVPGVHGWNYLPVYPPQTALLFWPLSYPSYLAAFAIWTVFNILFYGLCIWRLSRLYPEIAIHRTAVILSALAFAPFFNAIGHGQVSILALVFITVAMAAYLRDEWFLAGVLLGCLALKPPIFIAFLIVCAAVRAMRVIAGMVLAGVAQLALIILFAGLDSIRAYIEFAIKLPRVNDLVLAVKPYQMHSLRGFWILLGMGQFSSALWIVSSLVVLAILARYWLRESSPDLRFAALIVAAVLVDPHLYIYDAVILAPALFVAIAYARVTKDMLIADAIRVAVYVLFVCLFLGPLARITHLQLSVPVMCLLFFAMTHLSATPLRLTGYEPSAAAAH